MAGLINNTNCLNMETARTKFPPYLTVSICFALVGVAHVAALWLDLYRLVPLSLLLAFLAIFSSSLEHIPKILRGLTRVSPIYLYALISTYWSPDPSSALRDALYMCIAVGPAILLGIGLAHKFTGLQITYGLGVLLLPFAAQALFGMLQGSDPMLVGNWSMRSILANAICLVFPTLAGAWVYTRRPDFLVFGLIAGALIVAIGSRSAILFALPAALFSMYLQNPKFARRTIVRWALPLSLVVLFAKPSLLEPFSSDATNLTVDEWSVFEELRKPPDERVDIDRRLTTLTAMSIFSQHPLFGGGYSSVLQTNLEEFEREISAHGLIPGTLGELGVVGMSIVLIVIWRAISRARLAIRRARVSDPMLIHFLVSFGAILLIGLFHQTIESIFFGLSLGLLIGIDSRFERGRRVQETKSGPKEVRAS